MAAGFGEDEAAVARLYEAVISGWNARDGDAFAAPFAVDGTVIGFDGSEVDGRDAIASEMTRIFADHETAPYVAKTKSLRLQSGNVVLSSRASPDAVARKTKRLVADEFGLDIDIVVRKRDELAQVVKRNPLGKVAKD